MSYELNILHLYPDLLNLYGDKGNIMALKNRLLWRGINANVSLYTANDNRIDFENTDIIILGGGSDREVEIVISELSKYKNELSAFIEGNKTFLAVCDGFKMLGEFETPNGEISGLKLLDISTSLLKNKKRLIGNVILENESVGKIVGFENHNGVTDIKSYSPLGKVLVGYGNTEDGQNEGITYKNLIGTNLHGPLLPKNPKLCDLILNNALKNKYADFSALSPMDDSLENSANKYIVDTFLNSATE